MKERFMNAPPLGQERALAKRQTGHGDHPLDAWLKPGRIPHIWCSGCGNGIILTAFIKALEKSGFEKDKTVVVSGIGCSGRTAGYLDLDTYHTTHGRAIAFATGVKLANPELNVVVISGDGDLFAIGGNHFIHAARRNLDITVICGNNFNYGMTGGQGGPTTPLDAKTTTTPYGSSEHPFNLVHMAQASGAVYVARWTALHTYEMRDSMIEAMRKPGFAFIEIISPCPTAHGRRNKLGAALDLMKSYNTNAYHSDKPEPEGTALDLRGKIAIGKFTDIEKPTFQDLYQEYVATRSMAPKKAPK
jgi:2-oxoglutarate/2-oxoacid ferredoxin oxidoreductase subunit beta